MIMHDFPRGGDNYHDVRAMLCGAMPVSYFAFPASLLDYGESLVSGNLVSVDNGEIFMRRQNKNLSLLAYNCSGERVVKVMQLLVGYGYKIRTCDQLFAYRNNIETIKSQPYYISAGPFDREEWMKQHNAHQRKKLNKIIRMCDDAYELVISPDITDVYKLFNEWVIDARTRHFMVVVGDSKRFIEHYYAHRHYNTLAGLKSKNSGEVRAIMGYEVYDTPTCKYAQISMIKHKTDIDYFSRYVWLKTLELIAREGVEYTHAGANSDVIKKQMGFIPIPSFRIVI